MNKDKRLKVLPTNDLLFQQIFGKVGNEEITKDFLEKLLGIKIKGLSLDANKRMQGDKLNDKISRLDVKAKLSNGTVVIIEMQVAPYKEMAERMLYYLCKTYLEGVKSGDLYHRLHKTIAILITVENLNATKGIEDYHTVWNWRERKNTEAIFSNNMEIHTIELKKFSDRKNENPEDDWIKFINCKEVSEMEKLKSEVDEKIRKAIEEYNMLLADDEHQEDYEDRMDALRDEISFLTSAKEDGLAEGEKKSKIEIAKKMLAKNMNIEDIIYLTELTEEEIEKLRNN